MSSTRLHDRSYADRVKISVLAGIGLGTAIGALSALIALAAAAGGHGSYTPAAILFPYTMLSTRFLDSITTPFVALALIQFPLYGFTVVWMRERCGHWKSSGGFVALHVMAAVAALYARGEAFYP
jgi:hypothetical protein